MPLQTEKLTSLLKSPKPLLSEKHKLALFWSAKAGCTFAIKWFFYQIDFLDVALSYNSWIHKYRNDVYDKLLDDEYYINSILDPRIDSLKVVRNPYSRAVSSYVSLCSPSGKNPGSWQHHLLKQIGKFLNRSLFETNGLSFREFVAYLETIDLNSCNMHYRLQLHPSEKENLVKPKHIIKLENSSAEFQELERKLGLRTSDSSLLSKSGHHTRRKDDLEFCGDRRFELYHLKSGTLPPTNSFYDEELIEKISNLYRLDFETYFYEFNVLS